MESSSGDSPPRYERAALGTNALKGLGLRLAMPEPLSDADESLYQSFIVDADTRRIAVQAAIDESLEHVGAFIPRLSVRSTGRTKTRATLREKLQRDPRTKLPSIRDVAGVRVVADCTLLEMSVGVKMVRKFVNQDGPLRAYGFTDEARLIDRLVNPMHGYRALHLEVRLDGAPAEIQFRTHLQHLWAEFMELLGDRWGREPRYGLPLVEDDPTVLNIKQAILARMGELSILIAKIEDATERYGVTYMDFDAVGGIEALKFPDGTVEGLREVKDATEPAIAELHNSVRESTDQLRQVLDVLESITAKRETP